MSAFDINAIKSPKLAQLIVEFWAHLPWTRNHGKAYAYQKLKKQKLQSDARRDLHDIAAHLSDTELIDFVLMEIPKRPKISKPQLQDLGQRINGIAWNMPDNKNEQR